MDADKFMTEARARIVWGEPSSSVRDFLISNGVSDLVADAKLKEFELERRRELRGIGLRNLLIGIVLTGCAGITLYMALRMASASSGIIKALALVLLAGMYGLWKLVKGVVYLVRPQSEHKSIPDIVQSDLIE
ncbi:MAG TPA: hypothetical protein VNZ64_26365 [Candidatus Acidoferrum sp.]|jgi:hypothetical protein|nr:hypothetical protein [Candidatus Acidoferrum sp.]